MARKFNTVRGHVFQGNPIEELKTTPDQFTLFQTTLAPGTSSTIELYDAMPKTFASHKEMEALRKKNRGQFLDTLVRSFEYRGETYQLTVRPARIRSANGEEREFYPSQREDLIEQALRKLARDPKNGIYLGDNLAVQFSLPELSRELERTGHGMTYSSLKEGLEINNVSHVELTSHGKPVVKSSIFPVFIHADREQWEKNPAEAKCYVKFHPLVTVSVAELTNRQLDYESMMRLKHVLSYYLFKRMSHLYTQADYHTPYSITMSTLLRDSGMPASANPSDNRKRLKRTLEEFKAKGVIMYYEEEITRGRHNRIVEVKFSLFPTLDFKDHVVKANQHQQTVQRIAADRDEQSQR